MTEFFQRLKQRKLVQWSVAYVAGAFALLQGVDIVAQRFAWPDFITRALIIAACVGFFLVLVLAWYHGERGVQRVDGTELLILAILLAIGGGLLWHFAGASHEKVDRPATTSPPTAISIPDKSIAVLPFENLSRDPENAYFSEGIQDEILTRLAKIADLKVISRTSTQRFKSSPDNLPEIARRLGVAHILEGSVQKAGDQVRVNVQLIKAESDAHLWADTFDRKLTDIFVVESEIASNIAETLQAKLTGSEKILIAKKSTADPEAYELFLKGRFFWNKRTAADLKKAIEYFDAAIAKDPDYALAYAAVAQSWLILPAYGGGSPKKAIPPAETAIHKALELDESSSDAHAARGMMLAGYQFDFPGGKKEYERALQLNPNDATAHHWFSSDVLAALGESEREIAEMKRARELDPLSLVINTNLGAALLRGGHVDEAIAQLRKTVALDGSFGYGRQELGMALEVKGIIPEAIAEYQAALALNPSSSTYLSLLGHLYGTIGRKDEATRLLGRIQDMGHSEYVDPYYLAIVHLGLGDREAALSALEKSCEELNGNTMEYIRTDPFLDPLRGEPRFEALAEKIVPAREFKGPKRSR